MSVDGRRKWKGKPEAQAAVYANRRRIRSPHGQCLQKRRAELVERDWRARAAAARCRRPRAAAGCAAGPRAPVPDTRCRSQPQPGSRPSGCGSCGEGMVQTGLKICNASRDGDPDCQRREADKDQAYHATQGVAEAPAAALIYGWASGRYLRCMRVIVPSTRSSSNALRIGSSTRLSVAL